MQPGSLAPVPRRCRYLLLAAACAVHPAPGLLMTSRDVNVIALVKGEERYVFLFDDDSREAAIRALGRHAANPELNFSWYDAAVLAQKVRQAAPRPRRLRIVPRADRRA